MKKLFSTSVRQKLTKAIENGELQKVMDLLREDANCINEAEGGYAPIHTAVFNLRKEDFESIPMGEVGDRQRIIEHLITSGADFVNLKDEDGFSALQSAIYTGLYRYGDHQKTDDLNYKISVLYMTVAMDMTRSQNYSRNHICQALEEMIKPRKGPQKGASISLIDFAIYVGSDSMTSLLAAAGVNPCNSNGYGLTSLHFACLVCAHEETIDRRHKESDIRKSIHDNRIGILKWLLQHINENKEYLHILDQRWAGEFKTDANNPAMSKNYRGLNETPLHSMIRLNQPELVELLLNPCPAVSDAVGADIKQRYDNKDTLSLAKSLKHDEIAGIINQHIHKQDLLTTTPPLPPGKVHEKSDDNDEQNENDNNSRDCDNSTSSTRSDMSLVTDDGSNSQTNKDIQRVPVRMLSFLSGRHEHSDDDNNTTFQPAQFKK